MHWINDKDTISSSPPLIHPPQFPYFPLASFPVVRSILLVLLFPLLVKHAILEIKPVQFLPSFFSLP